MIYLVQSINLMLMDYSTINYSTFKFHGQKAILPFSTLKNGSTLPSKSPAQNTVAHLNLSIPSLTTSSPITTTPSSPPAKDSEYPSANQWPQHNSKACYLSEELVARAKKNWKIISVLTLAKASILPDKASTCWLRVTPKSITARWSLPMMEKRRQILLSGQNRTFALRFASAHSAISTTNPSRLPM